MIDRFFVFLKKFIPTSIFQMLQPAYHFSLGWLAALWYGRPSEKMIVVGVTGTTGKTTTVFLIAEILKSAGYKTGYISTAMFSNGEKEWLNDKKMTMLGRFFTQRLLKRMVKNKCGAAIVETTSQGITQFRHQFINYDILVFTGLYPEHIEAHGGFENYKKAKGRLFAHLKNCRKKNLGGKETVKTIIANADDEYANYFLNFWAEKKITFGIKNNSAEIKAQNVNSNNGLHFIVDNSHFDLDFLGDFNVVNSLAAISVAKALDIPMERIKAGLEKVAVIPGRLEKISNDKNLTIIVDYAYEPNAAVKLYETVKNIPHNKIIHVLGSAGGGRDKSRRSKLGKLAGEKADFVIVTNEDPYEENEVDIINQVFSGVVGKKVEGEFPNFQFSIFNFQSISNDQIFNDKEKIEGKNCWRILDRREAIKKALELARENDIVLVTGKGCEQAICVADGKKIPWDDRKVIRELLQEIK